MYLMNMNSVTDQVSLLYLYYYNDSHLCLLLLFILLVTRFSLLDHLWYLTIQTVFIYYPVVKRISFLALYDIQKNHKRVTKQGALKHSRLKCHMQ